MALERQIFTLKQVVGSIRKTIEERYTNLYWVKTEMHKLNRYPSGHAFPELVQKENDKIVAQINASIWKHNLDRINQQFVEKVKEPLQEGTTLLMQVKIVFHETFGLSLQILDIDPSFSLGELQRERQETLDRLKKEGLLNRNQSLQFPLLPQRIAIISADTSKGLSDFKKVLEKNPWYYHFFTMLFPAYLQGDVAVNSIAEQLKRIEKVKSHFDIIAIVRGGGGEVGLSCYNNYELCKAIANAPLPVLTGIGHSTNLTVAEMISFRNAITPTELADFLLQAFHDFSVPVQESQRLIKNGAIQLLEHSHKDFKAEIKLFRSTTKQALSENNNLILRYSKELKSKTLLAVNNRNHDLRREKEQLQNQLTALYKGKREKLFQIRENIKPQVNKLLSEQKNSLEHYSTQVRLIDPVNVLKRGYSIALYKGKVLSPNNPPQKGDQLEVKSYNFTLETEIKSVTSNDNE